MYRHPHQCHYHCGSAWRRRVSCQHAHQPSAALRASTYYYSGWWNNEEAGPCEIADTSDFETVGIGMDSLCYTPK